MSDAGGGTMSGMHDEFAHDDAAYLLGALDEADRARFETHLAGCAQCRERVEELRPTVLALALVPPAAFEPEPETLLPGLLARAARERRRRRSVLVGLAATAAACAAALVVVLWPGGGSSSTPSAAREMRAVVNSPVHATAVLVARQWGTEIDLRCSYDPGIDPKWAYRLVVIDKSGVRHDAGSWRLVPDATTRFTGGTDVARDQVASVQVTLPDGRAILSLAG